MERTDQTLELRYSLAPSEQVDSGIGLGNRAKELEETAEAADAEEGELCTSIVEASSESEGNLPVDSLVGQGADQILNHHYGRRLIGLLRRRGGGPLHRLAPQRLLQVHLLPDVALKCPVGAEEK